MKQKSIQAYYSLFCKWQESGFRNTTPFIYSPGRSTSSLNVGIDIYTGNLPNFENPGDIAKYVGYKFLDGASAGGAGSLSRGVVNFAQSGFKFGSVVTGSNSALQLIDKSAGLAGGVEMSEAVVNLTKVKIAHFSAPAKGLGEKILKSSASLADDAASGARLPNWGGNFNVGKKFQFSVMSKVQAPGMSGHRVVGFKYGKFQGAIDRHNWVLRKPGQTPINQKFWHYHWGRGKTGAHHMQFGTGNKILDGSQLRNGWLGPY